MPLASARRALHGRQHAERQAVDLHELQGIDVVLVPFDDLPVRHRRRFDRHQFVEPVVRVCTENLIRVDEAMESPKLAE